MGYPGREHQTIFNSEASLREVAYESERTLAIAYGLRNKREIWRATEFSEKHRFGARSSRNEFFNRCSPKTPARRDELLGTLQRYGIIGPDAAMDNILSLKSRRLLSAAFRVCYRKVSHAAGNRHVSITHGTHRHQRSPCQYPSYMLQFARTRVTYYANFQSR